MLLVHSLHSMKESPVLMACAAALPVGSIILPSLSAAISTSSSPGSCTAGGCSQPLQVFQELRRCAGLLARPAIAAALQPELEAAAKLMDKHLEALQGEMEQHRDAAEGLRQGGAGASTMGCNISSEWRSSSLCPSGIVICLHG